MYCHLNSAKSSKELIWTSLHLFGSQFLSMVLYSFHHLPRSVSQTYSCKLTLNYFNVNFLLTLRFHLLMCRNGIDFGYGVLDIVIWETHLLVLSLSQQSLRCWPTENCAICNRDSFTSSFHLWNYFFLWSKCPGKGFQRNIEYKWLMLPSLSCS